MINDGFLPRYFLPRGFVDPRFLSQKQVEKRFIDILTRGNTLFTTSRRISIFCIRLFSFYYRRPNPSE